MNIKRNWEEFNKLSLEEKTKTFFKDKEEGENFDFYQNRSVITEIYDHAEKKGYVKIFRKYSKVEVAYKLTEKGREFISED
jgi:hypothetical protein